MDCRAQPEEAIATRAASIEVRNLQMIPADLSGFGGSAESCGTAGSAKDRLPTSPCAAGSARVAGIAFGAMPTNRPPSTWAPGRAGKSQSSSSSTARGLRPRPWSSSVWKGTRVRWVLEQEDEAWIAAAPEVNGLRTDTSSGAPPVIKCLSRRVATSMLRTCTARDLRADDDPA